MLEHAIQSTHVPTIIWMGQEVKLLKQLLLFGFEEQVAYCVRLQLSGCILTIWQLKGHAASPQLGPKCIPVSTGLQI